MTWIVTPVWHGHRADKALAGLSGRSRADARRALESGDVTVDNQVVRPRDKVAGGDEFVGTIADSSPPLEPELVPFEVLLEDSHLAVVDKPAGVVTHPGAGRRSGTLAGGILHRWPQVEGVGATDRWGIVHRLDRDTSGLLVVALDADAYAGLTVALKKREIAREYLCLVVGSPSTPTGTIDAPIRRDRRRPTRMRVDADGRSAVTHYAVEQAWSDHTLLRIRLETGRTHQIRVHLASIGLPVAGDPTYGRGRAAHRLFLHSTRLAFEHPITQEGVEVESDLPADLSSALPPIV